MQSSNYGGAIPSLYVPEGNRNLFLSSSNEQVLPAAALAGLKKAANSYNAAQTVRMR